MFNFTWFFMKGGSGTKKGREVGIHPVDIINADQSIIREKGSDSDRINYHN